MVTPIVDAHVHLGAWRHSSFASLDSDVVSVTRTLRASGVSGVVLLPSDAGDNDALLNAVRTLPLDVWAVLWARPAGGRALRSLIESHPSCVRGIKIHPSLEQCPIDDSRWDEVLALAGETQLPVVMHTGRWQAAAGFGLALTRAAQYPRVRFVLSHAGGDTPDLCLGAARAVREQRLDNVAFDMAGVREHWALVRAMGIAGAERYLFGSDFPLALPAMYLAQIGAMALGEADRALVLGGNALRIFGSPSTAGAVSATRPELQRTGGLRPELARAQPSASAPTTVLVTGAGGPLGVNVTRSLRIAPRPLTLIGTDANPYHRPLALTDVCVHLPHAHKPEYVDALNELIAAYRVDLVVPTHPVEVQAIGAARERIGARLLLPAQQAILLGRDKFRSYECFRDAGVAVPRSLLISAPEDVERAFAELGPPPIWFRGSGEPGAGIGVASLPCATAAVAQAWVEHHRGYGYFMASELLPGANLTWLGVYADGTLFGCQTRERLEYVIPHVSPSGITGAPAVCRTVVRGDVRRTAEAALRAVCPHPHGVFFVDLKCDRQGVPRVTEINVGRFGTTIHFYSAAGFNVPALYVELALGARPAAKAIDPIPAGTYWLRTLDCGPVLCTERAFESAR